MRFFTFTVLLGLFTGSLSFAQNPVPTDTTSLPQRIFQLGEVLVKGQSEKDSGTIPIRQMEAFNRLDVASALNLLPGLTLSKVGARNESMVFVRGFDLRQVPVFVDGIPVYVPYDGYVDLARFTTFDLSQITVAKGFSSVTYGPNTLGGAINLVSRRPASKLEFDSRAGWMSGKGYRLNLNVGSRLGKFYLQGGISQLKQETYPLSKDFSPKLLEDGGDRDNAHRRDTKYSLKIGFTPNATDEYAISYLNQQGKKGTPPYVGNDPKQTARFWQWPYWNKESLYFISRTALSKAIYLKTRLYYDRFSNALFAFDDNTYSSQKKPSSFQSYYQDDTYGGSLEYGQQWQTRHTLKASLHYKQDKHGEHNLGEPTRTFVDYTLSLGVEDVYQLSEQLTILPGMSLNTRHSIQAQNFDAKTGLVSDFTGNQSEALNGQLGLFYTLTPRHKFNLSVARKSRFPTIKDRYSYRLGAAIPNPDLEAETAMHYEAGYGGIISKGLQLQASFFYSRLSDVIQQVNNVQPNVYQLQNAGKAAFYGSELFLTYSRGKAFTSGLQYTWLQRNNLTRPELKFTDVPPHKVFAHVQYGWRNRAFLTTSFEYNAPRYSTSYGTKASDYGLLNLKGSVRVQKYISLEGGINNVLDKNYALSEGFPEEGRNYFINLIISNL